MITLIYHNDIGIKIYIKSESTMLHKMIWECFRFFDLSYKDEIDDIEKVLQIIENDGTYRIDNFDYIFDDLNSVLGTLMEIICSDYFLSNENHVFIHGAAMLKDNELSLIIAPTMQGKSTLAALLATNGYQYLSDDVIPISLQDFTVTSYPKIMCIRNKDILQSYKSNFESHFLEFCFNIKNIDNTTKNMEERYILLPRETISTSSGRHFKIKNIYFIERNETLGNQTELLEMSNDISIITLMKNLRSPDDLGKLRKIASTLIKTTKCYRLIYGSGYGYMRNFL